MSRSKIALSVLAISILTTLAAAATASAAPPAPVEFTHGVASGDVTTKNAILWTRVDRKATIEIAVFDNSKLEGEPVYKRKILTRERNDFTASARATGLKQATTYYFRWRRGSVESPVGTFTTASDTRTSTDVRFTYSGDSDGTKVFGVPYHGNFEVLDAVRQENADFFVYLGDTIYSDSSLRPAPAETLDEYRDAYKVNRDIEALPNLLRSTSIYAQWDDHEVMNDYDGQTVDPDRYANGRKAFLEYMPMQRPSSKDLYPDCAGKPLMRTFQRGKDVDIFIPDERSCRSASVEIECQGDLVPTLPEYFRIMFGQTPQPPEGCLEAVMDPSRTMLGSRQKQQFKDALLASTAKFKLVMSQLAIQQYYALPYDRWEGYGAERAEILNFIRDNEIKNVIFLTTDNHANIVNEVFVDRFTDPEPIANELITGPIATFTLEEEIIGGYGPELLQAFHGILNLVEVDCSNLNTDSYGVVDFDSDAGTVGIELKDADGEIVHDQLDPSVPCTKTFG